jgi:hypothetical protein
MKSQANPSCLHLHPRPQLAELQDYSHNKIRELQPQLPDLHHNIYTPHVFTTTPCTCEQRHTILTTNAKPASTPLPAGFMPEPYTGPVDEALRAHYQMVIGSLLFLTLGS